MEQTILNEQVKRKLEQLPGGIAELFLKLRQMLYTDFPGELEETLWAGLPSYYHGDCFVRLIPFRDHINIEAKAVLSHREELAGYKITPKGMLQLSLKQEIPFAVLEKVFAETLHG